ncbi:hypothetical protein SARC_03638 [Sphaeroforma arctica JP610]|uniref:Uncharacterized protein n=1 Tax=Sphaeroforma arctica JP610 TaxID=667725 RepID=A0A0L0G540_9EUKA|nr:hypothetical protein SARC_03638 [Sphaeroforma arctica JP610]KNC84140.1 hypothetical protein SARC_03638 [Sphaeroforma arctica JP610]|eukprot:XP_014158042.1 hypothetical protein SARC_03638 [Sphaeroforma arctica JP610]
MGHEFLLLLLEAFIYDPVVDWAVRSADNSRLQVEVMSALRALSVRVAEVETDLKRNAVEVHEKAIPSLLETLTQAYARQHDLVGHANMVVMTTNRECALQEAIQQHGDIHTRIKNARAAEKQAGEREKALKRTIQQRLKDATAEVTRVQDAFMPIREHIKANGGQLTRKKTSSHSGVPPFLTAWLKGCDKDLRKRYTEAVKVRDREVAAAEATYQQLSTAVQTLFAMEAYSPPIGSQIVARILKPIAGANASLDHIQFAKRAVATLLQSWPPSTTAQHHITTVHTSMGRLIRTLTDSAKAIHAIRTSDCEQTDQAMVSACQYNERQLVSYATTQDDSKTGMSSAMAAVLTAVGVALTSPDTLSPPQTHTHTYTHTHAHAQIRTHTHAQPREKADTAATQGKSATDSLRGMRVGCCTVRKLTDTVHTLVSGVQRRLQRTRATTQDQQTVQESDSDNDATAQSIAEDTEMSWVSETCQALTAVSSLFCDSSHAVLALATHFDTTYVPQLIEHFVWGDVAMATTGGGNTATAGRDQREEIGEELLSNANGSVKRLSDGTVGGNGATSTRDSMGSDFARDMVAMATLAVDAKECARGLGLRLFATAADGTQALTDVSNVNANTHGRDAFDVASAVSGLRRRYRALLLRPWAAPLRNVDANFKSVEQQYDSLAMECDVNSAAQPHATQQLLTQQPPAHTTTHTSTHTPTHTQPPTHNTTRVGENQHSAHVRDGAEDGAGYSSRDVSWLLRVVAVCGAAADVYAFGRVLRDFSGNGIEAQSLDDVQSAVESLHSAVRVGGLHQFAAHFFHQRLAGVLDSVIDSTTRVVAATVTKAFGNHGNHGNQDDDTSAATDAHAHMATVTSRALANGTFKTTERAEAVRLVHEVVSSTKLHKQLTSRTNEMAAIESIVQSAVSLQRRFEWRHETVIAYHCIHTQINTQADIHPDPQWILPRRSDVVHTLQTCAKTLTSASDTRRIAEEALLRIEKDIKGMLARSSSTRRGTSNNTPAKTRGNGSAQRKGRKEKADAKDATERAGNTGTALPAPTPTPMSLQQQFGTWMRARAHADAADADKYSLLVKTRGGSGSGVCAALIRVYGSDVLPPSVLGQMASLKSTNQRYVLFE